MAQQKYESDEKYIEDQIAESQQDPEYAEGDNMPAEQYNSPESMKANQPTSHKGRKSSTHINKG